MRRAAIYTVVLALAGCATTTTAVTAPAAPDRPGARLVGWAAFFPAAPQLGFVGASSKTVCEAMRLKARENAEWIAVSPCVPVTMEGSAR